MTGRGVHELLRDFALAKDKAARHKLPKKQQKRLDEYHAMVLQRQHVLIGDPGQLWTVASGRPAGSAPREDTKDAAGPDDRPWFRAKHPVPEVDWVFTIELGEDVNALASYMAHGREVLLVASGNVVRRFDATTGEEVTPPLTGHTDSVRAVCALGGGRVATGSDDDTARVWDADTGACVRTLHGHTGRVLAVCALGGGRVATGSRDKTARVWDADTGTCLATFPHDYPITALCAAESDGTHTLVAGDSRGNVLFFDLMLPRDES
jgi:WD40 repeat protein